MYLECPALNAHIFRQILQKHNYFICVRNKNAIVNIYLVWYDKS